MTDAVYFCFELQGHYCFHRALPGARFGSIQLVRSFEQQPDAGFRQLSIWTNGLQPEFLPRQSFHVFPLKWFDFVRIELQFVSDLHKWCFIFR